MEILPGSPNEQDLLRDRLFSYIFHELRTPLTVIHSYAQILQTRLPPTPEFNNQRRISEQMVSQGDAVVEMIEELLEASRITLGRLDLDLVEYNFIELLQNLIEHLPSDTQARVNWQPPVPNDFSVLAEGPRLERALTAVLEFSLLVSQTTNLTLDRDEAHATRLSFSTVGWQPTPQDTQGLFDLYRSVRQDQYIMSDHKAGSLDISMFVARGLIEGHKGTLVYDDKLPGFVVTLPLITP